MISPKPLGRRIGELKMRTLYSELKDLLEEIENHE
mgnify:CR=1 FL=1